MLQCEGWFQNWGLTEKSTVVVGMSGGVDSSVTAAVLKKMGLRVIGLFMKNWEEENDAVCSAAADFADVRRVADHIGIPYYTKNFSKEYQEAVFADFLEKLRMGKTPNPDILCNREIKFKRLFQAARELGADAVATGHYAQHTFDASNHYLMKGVDPDKDQSYFLYAIDPNALARSIFPLGLKTKKEVRALAREWRLPTAEKKDSTGICFIGERNFTQFIHQYLPYQPGNFTTLSGVVVGQHKGVAYYTIGQRRGLGIGGKGDAWYVVGKDVGRNIVFVEQSSNHPALFAQGLIAYDPAWLNAPPTAPFHCTAKIRYRQADQPCTITQITPTALHVHFATPQRAITPEQSIVFYSENRCLGGAIILEASSV